MRWNNYEINILKNHYLSRGEDFVSGLVSRSSNAVRIKAFYLGIKRVNREINLSASEGQVLIGSLLGDMYCCIKKGSCKNAHVEEAHCEEQIPYLEWKIGQLKSLEFNKRRTKIGALHARSRVYPALNAYYGMFYEGGKKRINLEILNRLNALGLAVWYMDDGSYHQRNKMSTLYTNGFSYDETLMIKEWFKNRWNLLPKIFSISARSKKYYYPSFGASETRKLVNIIQPYIHQSMRYKIGDTCEKDPKGNGGIRWETDQ